MSITFRGGRLPNNPEKPRLRLANFLNTADATVPVKVNYLSEVQSFPMYMNDKIGDCTCAGAAHIIQAVSTYGQGSTITITDDDVLAAYEANSGYDPNTGANDNGAVMQDVLSYWRKTGIGGHQILAFAQLDVHNVDEVKSAMNLFGAVYVGINFPDTAMTQFDNNMAWNPVPGAKIDGGHAIHVGAYGETDADWKVVTWGAVQPMTQAFWDTYVEEAWVVITPEWLDANGVSPTGLNLQALGDELAKLTGGSNPFQEASV